MKRIQDKPTVDVPDIKTPILRCRDLFLFPLLKDAKLLAGGKGLDNLIERINVMEVPDVIDWVKPGEFLMTTGYPFRDNAEALIELIPQLVKKGVSALGIKTKRFIHEIPSQALEIANQLNFPIIELPVGTVFSDVVRDVMERVLFHEVEQISILQERIQAMSSVLLDGGGMKDLLKRLEQLLGNPIVLLDSSNRLVTSDATAILFEEHLLDESWQELRYLPEMGSGYLKLDGRQIRIYMSDIPGKRRLHSLLILLEWRQEVVPLDCLTLDRTITIAGLEMMNIEAKRQVESQYIDQFIQDWLLGRFHNLSDLRIRAEACGCYNVLQGGYSTAIVRMADSKPSVAELHELLEMLRRAVKLEGKEIYTAIIEGEAILVIPCNEDNSNLNLNPINPSKIVHLLRKLQHNDRVSLCLGKRVDKPEELNTSYREAKQIHKISIICALDQSVLTNDELGVYSLLYLLPECEEVNHFQKKFLQPLLDYDAKHDTNLVETLQMYFQVNRNMKQTAERLFTHYNTVIYRLERVKDILVMDLENPEIQLQLQLALKLHQMRV
ncbi:PucR family transcriptional regulator [Paenibacillus psychroresistens]|nr:PucR family transcriptional regulator ligand-binding domain-containing protein [Paenibacillus psychroresistens]